MSTRVDEILRGLTQYLQEDGVPDAQRDARLLLAHVMGVDPSRMTVLSQDMVSDGIMEDAFVLASDRRSRLPMSHILGYRAFYGRRFNVTGNVLDPRPETESLIEQALQEHFDDVLDLGTGSGCILVTLLAERQNASGVGTDLSEAALLVARENAERLGVADQCNFETSRWFQTVGGQYDLIVSNPPYIAANEMEGLAPELTYEPRMALTDEADGLTAYRIICAEAPQFLKPNGRLMVEIGPTQGKEVAAMMRAAGLTQVQVLPDLDSRDRVVAARKPAETA